MNTENKRETEKKNCKRCHVLKDLDDFQSLNKKGKIINLCFRCQLYKKQYYSKKYSQILKSRNKSHT
jgi:hypothetical protein